MCCSLSLFSNPSVNKIVINHVTYFNTLKLTQTVLYISIKTSITVNIYHTSPRFLFLQTISQKFCGQDKVTIRNMVGVLDYKHTLLWMFCAKPISCFEDFLNNSSQARFDAFKSCCLGLYWTQSALVRQLCLWLIELKLICLCSQNTLWNGKNDKG